MQWDWNLLAKNNRNGKFEKAAAETTRFVLLDTGIVSKFGLGNGNKNPHRLSLGSSKV
jgi:hypothetical protein